MLLKRGGGGHMQPYDSHNGEYTNKEKERMKMYDDFALWSYEWNGNNSHCIFHFPIEGVHDVEYCERFVRVIRNDIHEPTYIEAKMRYLLTFHAKDDKSKFILSLGYSSEKPYELFHDICANTNRDTIKFSRFSHGAFLLTAKTMLKGKEAITVWKLEESLDIRFITLIPGGDKKWKK